MRNIFEEVRSKKQWYKCSKIIADISVDKRVYRILSFQNTLCQSTLNSTLKVNQKIGSEKYNRVAVHVSPLLFFVWCLVLIVLCSQKKEKSRAILCEDSTQQHENILICIISVFCSVSSTSIRSFFLFFISILCITGFTSNYCSHTSRALLGTFHFSVTHFQSKLVNRWFLCFRLCLAQNVCLCASVFVAFWYLHRICVSLQRETICGCEDCAEFYY